MLRSGFWVSVLGAALALGCGSDGDDDDDDNDTVAVDAEPIGPEADAAPPPDATSELEIDAAVADIDAAVVVVDAGVVEVDAAVADIDAAVVEVDAAVVVVDAAVVEVDAAVVEVDADTGCATDFDCTPEAPICTGGTCTASTAACVDDDEIEDSDDGPAGATALPFAADTATTIEAHACTLRDESDWYSFTLAEVQNVLISLAWTAEGIDMDLYLHDAEGATISSGTSGSANPEQFPVANLDPGTYYVRVLNWSTSPTTEVTAYSLTLSVPECRWSGDCTTTGLPFCQSGVCIAGFDACEGDDATENDDDGAGLGTVIEATLDGEAATVAANICSAPRRAEKDWYRIAIGDGEVLTIVAAWEDSATDLDLYLVDADGTAHGQGTAAEFGPSNETITTSDLGAGTYYAAVMQWTPGDTTVVVPYSVSVTRATAGD